MKCSNCNYEADPSWKVCPQCGAPIVHSEQVQKICFHCGASLDEDALFCPECGKKLENVTNSGSQETETITTIIGQMKDYCENLSKQNTATNNNIDSNWSASFCEQLRQAYCNKDISFLKKAYSQNVQIITGAFENKTKNIRYRQQGYKQYVANLQYVFNINKKIDVTFENDSLTGTLYVSSNGRCQVVRLLQQWNSDKYSDRGYLLLVLYCDQNGPQIYIRAWQPEFLGDRHITAFELSGVNNIMGLR